jgi:adenylosuccinate synthase
MNRGTTLVFGGQVGSEGKGAIVGYLARRQRWDAAICTFMTNAGHTWLGDNGEKVVVQQLPMAVVGQDVGALLLAPGSAITLSQLEKEINELENDYNVTARLKIHPRAVIITDEHVEYEKYATKYLGSTSKGCGAALAVKAMRKQHVILARDIGWRTVARC